jgi:hypothetical protein
MNLKWFATGNWKIFFTSLYYISDEAFLHELWTG